MAPHPGGRLFVTGDRRGELFFWSVTDDAPQLLFRWDWKQPLQSLKFDASGKRLYVLGSNSLAVHVLDFESLLQDLQRVIPVPTQSAQ